MWQYIAPYMFASIVEKLKKIVSTNFVYSLKDEELVSRN